MSTGWRAAAVSILPQGQVSLSFSLLSVKIIFQVHLNVTLRWSFSELSKSLMPSRKAMAVITEESQLVPWLSEPFPVQPLSHCRFLTTVSQLLQTLLFSGSFMQVQMLVKMWPISFICYFFKQWLLMDFLHVLREVQALLSQNTPYFYVGRISSPSGCKQRCLTLVLSAFVLSYLLSFSYPDENSESWCLPVWYRYCEYVNFLNTNPPSSLYLLACGASSLHSTKTRSW